MLIDETSRVVDGVAARALPKRPIDVGMRIPRRSQGVPWSIRQSECVVEVLRLSGRVEDRRDTACPHGCEGRGLQGDVDVRVVPCSWINGVELLILHLRV